MGAILSGDSAQGQSNHHDAEIQKRMGRQSVAMFGVQSQSSTLILTINYQLPTTT